MLAARRFEAVFSDETLLELKDAVTSPRNVRKYGLRLSELNAFIRVLTAIGREVPRPNQVPAVSRDPDDDLFIALALEAQASCLVTRDDDLKSDPAVRAYLQRFGVAVLSVAEFVHQLEAE